MTATFRTDPKFKVLVFGDPHFALPAPSTRDPVTWQEEVEGLMRQVFDHAKTFEVDAIACPGDWFHLKASTSHECVRWVVDMLKPIVERFGPIITVPGNHDMVGNNVNDSAFRQPIAVLEAAGMIHRADLSRCEYEKHGQKFHIDGDAYPAVTVEQTPLTAPTLHLLHLEAMNESAVPSNLTNTMGRTNKPHTPCVMLNGHIHNPGPREGHAPEKDWRGGRRFVNIGVLNRVAINEAEWVPKVAIVILTPEASKIRLVELDPMVPGKAAFVVPRELGDTSSAESLRKLTEYLATANDKPMNVAAMLDDFAKGKSIPEPVIARAKGFIAQVG